MAFEYTVNPELDRIVEEKGNTYISLRKVKWFENSDVKLDLRKYVTNTDGSEKMMKGCSFDEEAGHELTHVLTEEGYEIIKTIVNPNEFVINVI